MSKSQLYAVCAKAAITNIAIVAATTQTQMPKKQVDHEALPEEDQKILYEKL